MAKLSVTSDNKQAKKYRNHKKDNDTSTVKRKVEVIQVNKEIVPLCRTFTEKEMAECRARRVKQRLSKGKKSVFHVK